jgi:N-acetylglucosaminyldiphosphoundecaprenol N-acetyl-beta-D-mannosaminyltransferase
MRVVAEEPMFEHIEAERVLGHPVHPVSKAQAAEAVVRRAGRDQMGAYVCLTNAHTTVESQNSPALRAAVENAYLSVPDGMPLAWILRRRGYPRTEKVTGIEYMPMVASAGLDAGLRHFLYGGRPGVADGAGRKLQQLVPGVEIVGTEAPPFTSIEEWPVDRLRRELHRTKPHVLWVGLGAPKQELWMGAMSDLLDVPMMVGVGAAFDYLAGTKQPAPRSLRHMGLEWLFRLAVEPKRLWRRYLVGNSTFIYLVLRDELLRLGRGDGS